MEKIKNALVDEAVMNSINKVQEKLIKDENMDNCINELYKLITEDLKIKNVENIQTKENNYDELIDATEVIIRFINFKGKHRFPAKNIIKIKDLDNTMIWPQNKNQQTDDEIRESAIEQYINIVKGRNMDTNDIPKEVMNKYLNEE